MVKQIKKAFGSAALLPGQGDQLLGVALILLFHGPTRPGPTGRDLLHAKAHAVKAAPIRRPPGCSGLPCPGSQL